MKKYDDYKDSGIKWIGEIPEHWEVNKVKHNFSFRTGFTPPSGKLEYYEDGQHIWINISDLQQKFIGDSANKITDKAIEDFKPTIVPKDSLLYSFKLSVGRVGFNTVDCYTNEAIFSIDPNGETNLGFFYYSLPQQIIKNANENIYGAKILNQELIKNASLIIPPPKEQTAIATYLDRKTAEIDELVADKKRLLELYEEEKTALINDLVTGKTVWDGASTSSAPGAWTEPAEVKDSGIEWLGDIPEDWEVKRLKYVVSLNDETLSEKTDEEMHIDYIEIGGLKNGNIGSTEYRFGNAPSRARRIVRNGDVIVSTVRTYLKAIAQISDDKDGYIASTGFAILRPKKIDSKFLGYYSNSPFFIDNTIANSVGVTYPAINASNILEFPIQIPPIEEQQSIVQRIETETARINAKKEKAEKLIELLTEYREALISEVVTGKIKVTA